MSVLADWEIRDLAVEKDMISPFVDHLESERDGKKILSYGLSSYGYELPPYGYCLGVAQERLKLPRDVTVVAVGKSTYARSGILVNITPAESGWEGYLTLEISNCTGLFNRIYADEGITQLLFYRGKNCSVTYQDRKGKYQNQKKEVVFSKV
jgi:dCTP deaminase